MARSGRPIGWGGLWLVVALLAGCGNPAPATLPPPVVSTPAGANPVPASSATSAGGLPQPGITVQAPTAPAATAQPAARLGPDTYPPDVNPLTGLAGDPARLSRIPVAVKISNFPLSVRPQFGLSQADLVFEHLAEAGLTRFTAIFLGQDADKVGSIRSARFIDAELAPMFGAALVTSGSSLGTMDKLRRSEWFRGENVWRLVSEESSYTCPPLCRLTPDDTNTLFAGTDALRQAMAAKSPAGVGRADLAGLAFSAAPPAGGAAVTEVAIHYSAAAQVAWRYSADSGRYVRWQEKELGGDLVTHLDAQTNAPISAANVVLLQANHVNNFVPEDFRDGGTCGLEIQLWTSGPARVFRDGVGLEGRWVRDASTGMRLRLVGPDGADLALRPGNTWFGLVTLNAVLAPQGSRFSVTNKVPDTKTGCPVPPTETPDPLALPTGTPLP